MSRSAALRADRHRPVPRSWPRREDRAGQGLAAGGGRSPRTAVPAAGRLVYARLADPGGPAARARRRRPGPARHGAVRPAAAPRSGPAWPPEGVWRADRRRCRGPPAGRDAPHRRLRRPGSPSAPRRVSSAVPARRRRPGGLVRVGQAPGRLGEAAPAALHGPGPVRAGGGRGLRAALGGGAPIRRAQADGRHGRDVAAGPQNAPALAAPGPDRPRTACPTDRAGGAGGARASAGRWLAQAGDADAGPGQGRACPPVRRYPGLPPRARNPQENRPCSWYRTARERRRRMTSGSNPRPPPSRSRKRRDQTRTAGAAAPRKLETRVNLRQGIPRHGLGCEFVEPRHVDRAAGGPEMVNHGDRIGRDHGATPASSATRSWGGMLPIAPWFTRRLVGRAATSKPETSSFSSQPLKKPANG